MDANEEQTPAAAAAPVPAVAGAAKPGEVITLSGDPLELPRQAKALHLYGVGGMTIAAMADAGKFFKANDKATGNMVAEAFLGELARSVKPRDAVEEMLVIQMAFVHQRVANLSLKAAEQELTRNVAVVNHALDQACNTFRRQMLALTEYRRRPQPNVFAPIRNANVAKQQVVQVRGGADEDSQHGFGANELGSRQAAPAALPAVGRGPGVPAGVGAAAAAVGAEHGPADGAGEGAVAAERAGARRAHGGTPGRAARAERGGPAGARRRTQTL